MGRILNPETYNLVYAQISQLWDILRVSPLSKSIRPGLALELLILALLEMEEEGREQYIQGIPDHIDKMMRKSRGEN
jgi:hypothetical protein